MDKIVVDMGKINQASQVNVAVSRVRTLEGLLQILNFRPAAIRKDNHAAEEMDLLRQNCIQVQELSFNPGHFIVAYLNIRGYQASHQDVIMDSSIHASSVVTFTEFHL